MWSGWFGHGGACYKCCCVEVTLKAFAVSPGGKEIGVFFLRDEGCFAVIKRKMDK